MKYFFQAIAAIISLLFGWILNDSGLTKIGIGLFIGSLIELATKMWEIRKIIKLYIQTHIFRRNEPIRISIAYLFKIVIDGKYLLVRNHRDQPGFQPVGGVYKFLPNENRELFAELGITPCNKMGFDDQNRNDLRLNMKHRSKLYKFLKWFDTKKNRELDPWREFFEELIADNIIDQTYFPYIQYNYCKPIYTGVRASEHFPGDEFIYADIIELKIENSKQENELRRLLNTTNDKYIFVTIDEINKGLDSRGNALLSHCKKLI